MTGETARPCAALGRLCALLPKAAPAMEECAENLHEVRLRAGRPAQLVLRTGERFAGPPLGAEELKRVLSALLDHSVYAREDELAAGFFTLPDGARVGVCGRMRGEDGRIEGLSEVGSLCVRLSRQIRGCAEALLPLALREGRPRPLLIASAPGMGKTTCLRELARRLSDGGLRVAIADERHELAACHAGIPTLDVGTRTDVMDGGPKARVIPLLIRSMAPQAIVTDEIGDSRDAMALREAARCGVAVVASAHGDSLEAVTGRSALKGLFKDGLFETVAILGGAPGRLAAIHARRKGADGTWRYD